MWTTNCLRAVQLSEATVPPGTAFGSMPHPPTTPPHPSPSCWLSRGRLLTSKPQPPSQLSCEKQGQRLRLAGDNVRINDKICKACRLLWEGGKGAMDVLFPLNPISVCHFFPPCQRSCFDSWG